MAFAAFIRRPLETSHVSLPRKATRAFDIRNPSHVVLNSTSTVQGFDESRKLTHTHGRPTSSGARWLFPEYWTAVFGMW
jgi:hypothetical protein